MSIFCLFVYIGLFCFENLPTSIIICGILAQVRLAVLSCLWLNLDAFTGVSFRPAGLLPLLLRLLPFLHQCCDHGEELSPNLVVSNCFTGVGQSLSRLQTLRGVLLPIQRGTALNLLCTNVT